MELFHLPANYSLRLIQTLLARGPEPLPTLAHLALETAI